jgi:hypothetical protein
MEPFRKFIAPFIILITSYATIIRIMALTGSVIPPCPGDSDLRPLIIQMPHEPNLQLDFGSDCCSLCYIRQNASYIRMTWKSLREKTTLIGSKLLDMGMAAIALTGYHLLTDIAHRSLHCLSHICGGKTPVSGRCICSCGCISWSWFCGGGRDDPSGVRHSDLGSRTRHRQRTNRYIVNGQEDYRSGRHHTH